MKKHFAAAAALFACTLPFAAHAEKFALKLTGFQETPLTLSSPASGEFEARIVDHDNQIDWELSYRGFPTNVLQAHIHFGARAITGGISIFLCTNLGNGPAGTQPCPQMGTISGHIRAADVIGPAGQGIAPGELAEIIAAIRAGAAYVNVHTTQFPGGEIRAQFGKHPDRDRGHHGHDD
jgi:CHRD domain